jgi:hypothetical protein
MSRKQHRRRSEHQVRGSNAGPSCEEGSGMRLSPVARPRSHRVRRTSTSSRAKCGGLLALWVPPGSGMSTSQPDRTISDKMIRSTHQIACIMGVRRTGSRRMGRWLSDNGINVGMFISLILGLALGPAFQRLVVGKGPAVSVPHGQETPRRSERGRVRPTQGWRQGAPGHILCRRTLGS